METRISELSGHELGAARKRPPLRRGLIMATAAAAGVVLAGSAQASSLTPIASYSAPGDTTAVLGINDSGFMTGAITQADGSSLGFVRDGGGTYSTFQVDFGTVGRAIDGANNVSGYATDSTGNLGTDKEFIRAPGGSVTVLQDPTTLANLHGIAQGMNNTGAVVGDYFSGGHFRGYELAGGTLTDLMVPGSSRTAARGIADDGTIAGWTVLGGVQEGFIYSGGVYSLIGVPFPGATGSVFEDINNNGQAVGEFFDGSGNSHAYEYNTVTHSFFEMLVAGATNVQAFGINDAGLVVLTTDIAHGVNNFLYNPGGVPEPQTWALMLMGFGAAGVALRRRRTAVARPA